MLFRPQPVIFLEPRPDRILISEDLFLSHPPQKPKVIRGDDPLPDLKLSFEVRMLDVGQQTSGPRYPYRHYDSCETTK